MEVDGKYFKEKLGGYYRSYQEIEGMKIPTEGEVEWNLSDRDLPNISYNLFISEMVLFLLFFYK